LPIRSIVQAAKTAGAVSALAYEVLAQTTADVTTVQIDAALLAAAAGLIVPVAVSPLRRPMGRRCLDHADADIRQYQCAVDHDR
jgi:hypothetical protein